MRPEADLAVAPPPCGTVTTNTNLSGDCTGPLVVGASGINVNLGGHAVTCGPVPNPQSFPFSVGIEISAQTNDHVTNGEVENCVFGIEISQGGGHELSNLDVHNHGRIGIVVESSNNDIRNTISSFNGFVFDGLILDGFGVIVFGNSNKLDQLQIEQNGRAGIELDGGTNVVTSSVVLGDGRFSQVGIVIVGSKNTIDLSTQVSQYRLGIVVANSTGNTIRATKSFQNLFGGILLGGVTNTTIQASDASNNGGPGIRLLSGATSNLITSNKAFGNGFVDLDDYNPACDSNTWKSNQFGTANQSCIN
jgi:parallel beta-helix repeat protein